MHLAVVSFAKKSEKLVRTGKYLQAKARVEPLGEKARVLFQQFVLMRKSTVPGSLVTPAKGPEPPTSISWLKALVMMTEPSADAEATTRPEPGSKRTHKTEALCRGLPRGGSSVCERATQKFKLVL